MVAGGPQSHLAQPGYGAEEGEGVENVAAHDVPLLRIKGSGLVQDGLRSAELPQVVQKPRHFQKIQIQRPEIPCPLAQLPGHRRHSERMGPGVGAFSVHHSGEDAGQILQLGHRIEALSPPYHPP